MFVIGLYCNFMVYVNFGIIVEESVFIFWFDWFKYLF